tara:strand:+ start:1272 stop:1514 length:243 start_codon:yes stop_codon:yes gene_type:complete
MSVFDLMNPFDPWITRRQPSVYVISDSELKDYKQKQAAREIAELYRLIDSHQRSIEGLEASIAMLKKEYPQLLETTPESA